MSSNRLTVSAADAAAEIAVLNGSLERVARGIGHLEHDLPSGLYKVRVRVGPTIKEELVSLDRDQTVSVDAAVFPSPIPLLGTSRTHEYHVAAAVDASRTIRDTFGNGGSVLVFVRDWTGARSGGARVPGNPAVGLSFLREGEKKELVTDLAAHADLRTVGDASAGWRADVSPGPYRLRLTLSDGASQERAVFIASGQQTQVFLMRTEHLLLDGSTELKADIGGGAIVVSPSQSFEPDDRRTRLAELARYALTQTRQVLSAAMLDELLNEKASDPILGLFGAHLLLRDEPQDQDSFETVTTNLRRILGSDHPDVQALLLLREKPPTANRVSLRSPPMLRASWDIAVAKSQYSPDVIPADTPLGAVATRILPTMPWLIWSAGDSGPDDRTQQILDVVAAYITTRAQAKIGEVMSRSGFSDRSVSAASDVIAKTLSLGAAEARRALGNLGAPNWLEDLSAGAPNWLEDLSAGALGPEERSDLSKALGLPKSVLDDMLKRIQR